MFLSLQQTLNQPTGMHQMGAWHFDRGENATALELFLRAVEWDVNSPPFRHTYAIALSTQGRTAEARVATRRALEQQE